jgi:ParB family transcriptional regulator, chromosome partitioning protein
MTDKPKSRGLGRGLSALMSDVTGDAPATPRRPDLHVPVESLSPNPNQPRRSFGETELSELTNSIREKGVIQPLIVRPDPTDADRYEIVAGERRWRAAQRAQLHEVPVIVRAYTDTEVLEVAIIENIQRADLNPIDEASAYRRLMERFGHTQDQLATALGKSRSHVANQMRLLSLPDEVQRYVTEGQLTAGHARALIGHPRCAELARRAITDKLSVREVERLTRQPAPTTRQPRHPGAPTKDADTVQIERELTAALGMGVTIDHKDGDEGGKLTIRYKTLAQLDDLLRVLSGG